MYNVINLHEAGPREENIRLLQAIMPDCIRQAAAEVGENGMKAFFNGYKDSEEALRKAA